MLHGVEVEEQPLSKGRTETECQQGQKRWDHLHYVNINWAPVIYRTPFWASVMALGSCQTCQGRDSLVWPLGQLAPPPALRVLV